MTFWYCSSELKYSLESCSKVFEGGEVCNWLGIVISFCKSVDFEVIFYERSSTDVECGLFWCSVCVGVCGGDTNVLFRKLFGF